MLGVAAPAGAATPDCGLGVPKVIVERTMPPVAFDFGQSTAELADRFTKRYPDKARSGVVLGETVLVANWNVIPVVRIETHGDRFCAVPLEVRVTIGYRSRTLHVAREIADDPCLR